MWKDTGNLNLISNNYWSASTLYGREQAYIFSTVWEVTMNRIMGDLYNMLSQLFMYPRREVADLILNGQLAAALDETADIFPALSAQAANLKHEADLLTKREAPFTELEVEYSRLFVGPGRLPAPLNESVYNDPANPLQKGLLMNDSVTELKELYNKHGFGIPEGFTDLPDAIYVELAFAAHLFYTDADAGDFLDSRLRKWCGNFFEAVENAGDGFYAGLAKYAAAVTEL